MRNKDLLSVFYQCIPTFPNAVCWRSSLFFNLCFWHPCQNQMAVDAWSSSGSSSPLVYESIFVLVPCCISHCLYSIIWRWVFWYPTLITLAIWCILYFHMYFRVNFSASVENWKLEFWWGVHWIRRLVSIVQPCSQCSVNPWTWVIFPSSSAFFNVFLQCFVVFMVEEFHLLS
jgi:hypothetical protein